MLLTATREVHIVNRITYLDKTHAKANVLLQTLQVGGNSKMRYFNKWDSSCVYGLYQSLTRVVL